MPGSNTFTPLFIILLLPWHLFSQIKIVSDKNTAAVPYAHIFLDNVFYTYSDENGKFSIGEKQDFDTLTVAHLSYETKHINSKYIKDNSIIVLQEKVIMLDEVSIASARKKWHKQTVMPGKSGGRFSNKHDFPLIHDIGITVGESENAENIYISRAVYIPNERKNDNAHITKIILNSVDKETQGDRGYMPFRVNLMSYDTIRKLPGERIFPEDFLSGKKKGQTVAIELSPEQQLLLPKEGICVVVTIYYTGYYEKQGLKPPAFETMRINKSSAFREYVFGLTTNKVWEEQYYSQVREQCFNFGLEIETAE